MLVRSYLNGLVIFPIFNLNLNLAIRSSWSEPQSAPGLVLADCIELLLEKAMANCGEPVWGPVRPPKTNNKKRYPFHHRELECKSRKSRYIWSNRQVWPWSTKWSRAKTNRVLPREHTGHSKHLANTLFQQHKRRIYIWKLPVGQYQNQIDYIFHSQRWTSSIQSVKTRPGADCGSDHELLIAIFRLKLKKVGKTTPFRYDLIQALMIIQWKWQVDSRDYIW